MSNTWVTSDHHFGDRKMITVQGRDGNPIRQGFSNVDQMNEAMIERWNETVAVDDQVFHLGDFALGAASDAERFARSLNGKIYLIIGNHDTLPLKFYDRHFFRPRGHHRILHSDYNLVFTHLPIHRSGFRMNDRPGVNVHGHLHADVLSDPGYINVCVEQSAYRPIALDDIIKRAKKAWVNCEPHSSTSKQMDFSQQ